jgi:hypothetical protein
LSVTASPKLSVIVIVLPTSSSPLAGDATSEVTVGATVSICRPATSTRRPTDQPHSPPRSVWSFRSRHR